MTDRGCLFIPHAEAATRSGLSDADVPLYRDAKTSLAEHYLNVGTEA
jgi:hypothetical protein